MNDISIFCYLNHRSGETYYIWNTLHFTADFTSWMAWGSVFEIRIMNDVNVQWCERPEHKIYKTKSEGNLNSRNPDKSQMSGCRTALSTTELSWNSCAFFVNSFDILSFNKCGRLLGHESSSRDKRERSRKVSFDEEGVSLVRDL